MMHNDMQGESTGDRLACGCIMPNYCGDRGCAKRQREKEQVSPELAAAITEITEWGGDPDMIRGTTKDSLVRYIAAGDLIPAARYRRAQAALHQIITISAGPIRRIAEEGLL